MHVVPYEGFGITLVTHKSSALVSVFPSFDFV